MKITWISRPRAFAIVSGNMEFDSRVLVREAIGPVVLARMMAPGKKRLTG